MRKKEKILVGFFFLFALLIQEGTGNLWGSFVDSPNKKKEEEKKEVKVKVEKKYSDYHAVYWRDPIGCEPHPPLDRYLLMSKRNGGWSNERLIIESAIVMAWITNRTLVIPHRMRLDHMHGNETFERFLDLSYARCHIPIILSSELPKLTNGVIDPYFKGVENSPETLTVDIQYNNGAFAVPRTPSFRAGDSFDELLEFERFRAGREHVFQLDRDDNGYLDALNEAGNKDKASLTVVDNTYRFLNSKQHFYMYYYAYYWFKDKKQHNSMIDLVKYGAHYADTFWDAALPILQQLGAPGSFSTVHIRSRDFRQEKGFYQYFKKKSWIENFQDHHKNTFLPGEKVYISTDEKNVTEIKEFQKQLQNELNVKTYTIYDFLHLLNLDDKIAERRWEFWGEKKVELETAKKFNLNDLALIEQIICAHGRRYVATYFSTYSAYTSRLRGYLHREITPWNNIKVDEHLFWDRTLEGGSQCTFNSKPETCIPSWTGKFRGAIWASEFEEGWSRYETVSAHQKARNISPQGSFPKPKHFKLFSPNILKLFGEGGKGVRKGGEKGGEKGKEKGGGELMREKAREREGFLEGLRGKQEGGKLKEMFERKRLEREMRHGHLRE